MAKVLPRTRPVLTRCQCSGAQLSGVAVEASSPLSRPRWDGIGEEVETQRLTPEGRPLRLVL